MSKYSQQVSSFHCEFLRFLNELVDQQIAVNVNAVLNTLYALLHTMYSEASQIEMHNQLFSTQHTTPHVAFA